MKILGFEIIAKKAKKEIRSPVIPAQYEEDTTLATSAVSAGGWFVQVLDIEGTIKTENDLIRRYRQVAQYSDCEFAINEIISEAIVLNKDKKCVEINLDNAQIRGKPVSENIKQKIKKEFDNVIRILEFEHAGQDLFRQWYIDGRLLFHVQLDRDNAEEGIQKLRKLDPRKIRRIKKIHTEKNQQGIEVITGVEVYYIYNDKGISENNVNGIKLGPDSIIHILSGLTDYNNGMTLSHLHKAIKPTNQLKMMEDSLVISRISRAPERRIFYVYVGNLTNAKAEQYMRDMMNKFRNKIVHDATTGEIRDDKRHPSIVEDFWMPRREGGERTEITTLRGEGNFGNIEDIKYFQTKLFRSLNVPVSRLQQRGFSSGYLTEVTRDEMKFNKFVIRLRKRFADLFSQTLRIQLIAKGIIREDEWNDLQNSIRYKFTEDNYFSERKDQEILRLRANLLQLVDPYVGKYFSKEWVMRKILKFTHDEIENMKKQMIKEKKRE